MQTSPKLPQVMLHAETLAASCVLTLDVVLYACEVVP